ncbi:hypothetical protein AVEN_154714-1 [Araneus ventricosus]|uniref:Uncharacterized protein n=1 Tax=Araneus ventricosus TaxID=182803 RepID=A0A4Y2UXB1_ARAVE|nr:hypothetical protein AVEN_154714-1 [Araneus ventricosus]
MQPDIHLTHVEALAVTSSLNVHHVHSQSQKKLPSKQVISSLNVHHVHSQRQKKICQASRSSQPYDSLKLGPNVKVAQNPVQPIFSYKHAETEKYEEKYWASQTQKRRFH